MIDDELTEFEHGLLESIGQAKRGEFAAVHTPEQIMARRGRPVGSVKADAKVAVKLRLDPDVLAALRATGRGWQTRVNDTMRDWVNTHTAA
jgi:uncharacterized protein (DUF4415 family)